MELHWFDRFDDPAVSEGISEFGLSDATGSPIARLAIAEASEQHAPAGPDNGRERGDVTRPPFVVKHVKEAAVEHGVELFVEVRQSQRVANDEACRDTSVGRLTLGDLDGPGRCVDTRGIQASSGDHERVFARPTAGVEHTPTNCALLRERAEHRLGAADVPWGRPDVALIEVFDASVGGLTRNLPPRQFTHHPDSTWPMGALRSSSLIPPPQSLSGNFAAMASAFPTVGVPVRVVTGFTGRVAGGRGC